MNQLCPDGLDRPIDVFVYGTLLQDEINHSWLVGSEFLGADQLANAELFNLGDYPMIVPGNGLVQGEVYRVSPLVLQQLDILEEHPNYYQRDLVTLQSGRIAFVYWGSAKFTASSPAISSGCWRARVTFCEDFLRIV